MLKILLLFAAFSSTSLNAALIQYAATLNGANESPVNASLGTGSALVTIDTVAQTMEVFVTFAGLTSGTTASHIHCCTASPGTGTTGVATITPNFTGFTTGVTSGTYDHLFDLNSSVGTYNPAFITANGGTVAGAEIALLAGLAGGTSYLNIHTTTSPGGEIRGFLTQTPEPGTLGMMGAAIAVAGLLRRKFRA